MQGYTFTIGNDTATIRKAEIKFIKDMADEKGDVLHYRISHICEPGRVGPDPHSETFPDEYHSDANNAATELFETGTISSHIDEYKKLEKYADPYGFWIHYDLSNGYQIIGYAALNENGSTTTAILDEGKDVPPKVYTAIMSNLDSLANILQ